MQKHHGMSKRILTVILAVALVLPSVSSIFAFGVAAQNDEKLATKTDGQIIAENYDLTPAEKDLLKSGFLMGGTREYEVPNASDDLISVDTDHKKIIAESFRADGLVWEPVKIDILVNSRVEETITEISEGEASYACDATAFAVKVHYEAKDDIDEDMQGLLLGASAVLKGGIDSLEAVLDPNGAIQNALDAFATYSTMKGHLQADAFNPNAATMGVLELLMADGDYKGYHVKLQIYNQSVNTYVAFNDTFVGEKEGVTMVEKDAAEAPLAQLTANGGKLDLQLIAKEYADAPSKVAFLAENAKRVQEKVVETYEHLYALTADQGCLTQILDTMALFMPESAVRKALQTYFDSITVLAGDKKENDGTVSVKSVGLLEAYCADSAWAIADEDKNPVKEGLTETEYLALDILVGALGEDIKGASATVRNPLTVDATAIQFNMSMYDVVIKVELQVVEDVLGSTTLVTYDTKTVTVTLAQNIPEEQILAAIEGTGVEMAALAAWAGVYVSEQFDCTKDTLPATLTGDIEYKITYKPKTYAVTSNYGIDAEVPYGYQLLLPKHLDSAQAYDYKVNGAYYAQGSVITVTAPVSIERTVGKSYTSYTINSIIANNFFADSSRAAAILNSGALKDVLGNTVVNVREPDEADGLVSLVGDTLTATAYPSSFEGLSWMPYIYRVVSGTTVVPHEFNGATTVTVGEASYDRVEVVYRLSLTNITGIQSLLDLPALLVGEAESQIAALDKLNAYYGKMGEIAEKKPIISALNTFIDEDKETDEATKIKLKDAINGLVSECFDGSSLKIYDLMTGYRRDGLAFYYQNSEKFHAEIETLNKYLGVIGGEKEALKRIVANVMAEAVEYIDEIDTIRGAVEELKNNLKAPNAAIDTASANLEVLTKALTSTGNVPADKTEAPLYLESKTFTKNADNKVTVTVAVNGKDAPSFTFNKGHVLTVGDVNAIIAATEAKFAELGYTDRYYKRDYTPAVFTALVGTKAGELDVISFAFTYSLKGFAVKIDGAPDAFVDLENRKIDLPASQSLAFRYDYKIFGKVVNYDSYTFTDEEFEKIVSAGGYTVEKTVVDVQRERYLALVNDLNAAIGSDLIVFALTEKDGSYAVIMRVDASRPTELKGALMGMAMELVEYGYVAFGDNALVYSEDGAMQISLQAVVDTLLGGLSSDLLIGMMDKTGNLNNMPLPGDVISDKMLPTTGAALVESELCLGESKDALTHQLPIYITLGGAPAILLRVRNLLANRLAPYFSFTSVNGELIANVTLPQKAYEAYLAVLLATENADITNVNHLNEQIVLGFAEKVLRPLMESDASLASIQNTLAKFGYHIDLSGYESAFELLREMFNGATFTYDAAASTYDTTLNVAIDTYLEKLDLGSLGSMIAEKDSGIKLPVGIALTNLDKSYEALYFDVDAKGITNKFGLVENVAEQLDAMAGTAIVILLRDVDRDLAFATRTVLDLNGFTVRGSVVGAAGVNVVDSAVDEGRCGAVTGAVWGNVTITGGKYDSDVSAYIPKGYAQNADGVVANEFVTVLRDENGNVTVKLNANVLAMTTLPDVKSLAVDLIVELLLNGFSTNKLYFNGERVYELTVADLVGIYTATDRKAALLEKAKSVADFDSLIGIVNIILGDVTDFDAISEVLKSDVANGTETPVLTYTLTTGAWGVSFNYIKEDDSVSLDVTTEGERTRSLGIVITGDEANKRYVASLMSVLADTTEATLTLDGKLGRSGSRLLVDLALSADVKVDFSKNTKYAVLLGTIVADGIGAPKNEALVLGLEDYFANGSTAKLQAAFNSVTVSQIITAAKRFKIEKTFAGMLEDLGLAGYTHTDAAVLEADLDLIGVLLGKVLNRAKIDGPAILLGSLLDKDTNTYFADKEDLDKSFSFGPYAGYSATLNLVLSDVALSVKLFDKYEPILPAIDYSALEAKLAEIAAENLDGTLYTDATWTALSDAITAATALIGRAADQAEVDEMLATLTAAREALALKPVAPAIDYTALEAKLAEIAAENLDGALYTDATWNAFMTAFNKANALIGNAGSQTEVDEMLADLIEARAGLELKPVVPAIDYSALEEKLMEIAAERLDGTLYTDATWNALRDAINAAAALIGNASSQTEVDEMLATLTAARAGLELKPVVPAIDYSALEAKLAEIAAENLDATLYTDATWTALSDAITVATALIGNAGSQTEVDEMLADLVAARAGLELKPVVPAIDYSALEAKLAEIAAENLDGTLYTEATWMALTDAINAAAALIGNAGSQTEVDEMLATLTAARAGLELKPVAPVIDYTALEAKLAEIAAERLDGALYTDATWNALTDAIAAATALVGNATSQFEVDEMMVALKAARAALTEKGAAVDYTTLEAEVAKILAENLNAAMYTYNSWSALAAALAATDDVIGSAASQAEVDEALVALKAARAALTAMNYTALNAAITSAEALAQEDYTEESWSDVAAALDAARAALGVNDQSLVDEAAAMLEGAIGALKEETSLLWLWITLPAVAVVGGGAALAYAVIRRKKMTDEIPPVNYDINDDNV